MQLPSNVSPQQPTRLHGTVTWFNPQQGFGFIEPELDGPTVFVHQAAVSESVRTLVQGERVTYQLVPGDKGLQAADVMRGWLELSTTGATHAAPVAAHPALTN